MPADFQSLNFENPTKWSGVTASQSDPQPPSKVGPNSRSGQGCINDVKTLHIQ